MTYVVDSHGVIHFIAKLAVKSKTANKRRVRNRALAVKADREYK